MPRKSYINERDFTTPAVKFFRVIAEPVFSILRANIFDSFCLKPFLGSERDKKIVRIMVTVCPRSREPFVYRNLLHKILLGHTVHHKVVSHL